MLLFGVLLLNHFAASPIAAWRTPRADVLPKWRYVLPVAMAWLVLAGRLGTWLRTGVLESFSLPANSMYPTLHIGDVMMTRKLAITFSRGDLTVFRYPGAPDTSHVKRIVATGGDTVELKNGRLIVNQTPLVSERTDRPCRPIPETGTCSIWTEQLNDRRYFIARNDSSLPTFGPIKIAPGHYFVLGDNRDNSNDSRFWGTLSAAALLAKPLFVYFSHTDSGVKWDRIPMTLE